MSEPAPWDPRINLSRNFLPGWHPCFQIPTSWSLSSPTVGQYTVILFLRGFKSCLACSTSSLAWDPWPPTFWNFPQATVTWTPLCSCCHWQSFLLYAYWTLPSRSFKKAWSLPSPAYDAFLTLDSGLSPSSGFLNMVQIFPCSLPNKG